MGKKGLEGRQQRAGRGRTGRRPGMLKRTEKGRYTGIRAGNEDRQEDRIITDIQTDRQAPQTDT